MEPHRNHVNCKAAAQGMVASCAAAPMEPHGTTRNHTGTTGLACERLGGRSIRRCRNHMEPHRNHADCKAASRGMAASCAAAPMEPHGTTRNHTGTTGLACERLGGRSIRRCRNHMEPRRNHVICKEALQGMAASCAAAPMEPHGTTPEPHAK